MKPKLILISGSINSGKSTTSQAIIEQLSHTAHIHGDSLRHFISWLPLDEAIPITFSNIIDVSKNFLSAGFNVVIDYPLLKPDFELIDRELQEYVFNIYSFVLSPRLEVAQSQRGERVLSSKEVERIAYHYGTNLHDPGFGYRIDNSNIDVEETVRIILDYIADEF